MKKQTNFKVDFIGIGAAKSGTTWLGNMLNEHPDICMSEPKEVNYFNKESNSSAKFRFKNKVGPFLNKHYNKPLSWYSKHFEHCKKDSIIGEFSPVYVYDPDAATAIKRTYPNVKLIITIRNPIDRAYSEYWMFKNSFQIEDRSFDEAIRGKETMYIKKGLYYKQLTKYLDLFSREQVHIIFYDDIKKNPEMVMSELYRFLGVDYTFIPHGMGNKSNYAKASRVKGAVEFMNNTVKFFVHLRMSFIVRIMKKLRINKLFLKLISKKVDYPKMDDGTRAYLRDVFESDIKNLERFLNVDLSHWE